MITDLVNASYLSEDTGESCSICLEIAGERKVNRLICGHIFHSECVIDWMERKGNCPVCRNVPEDWFRCLLIDDAQSNLILISHKRSIWLTTVIATTATTKPILHNGIISLIKLRSRLMFFIDGLANLTEIQLEVLATHQMQFWAIPQWVVEHPQCFDTV